MKVVDPVCKMELEKENTKFMTEYMGQMYYFDSEACLLEFEDDPEEYAEVIAGRIYRQYGERLDGSE
jgi:YHS domain-containing protein